MCETLATVVLRGELDRDLAGRFFRDAFMELRPQVRSFVWQGWQSTIAMLGLSELRILVKRAFDRGFIDPHWIGFDGFLRDLEWTIKRPGEGQYPQDNEFTLFGDTVEELSRWHGFSEECLTGRDQGLEQAEADFTDNQPYRNPFRGFGRNDPCPCGSGKKFKNCCLGR